jgi:hypothetical protein
MLQCKRRYSQCPIFEVRHTARLPPNELRKVDGHWQISDSSAAFLFEIPVLDSRQVVQEFQIDGTGVLQSSGATARQAFKPI